jgi:hypothetical protein
VLAADEELPSVEGEAAPVEVDLADVEIEE